MVGLGRVWFAALSSGACGVWSATAEGPARMGPVSRTSTKPAAIDRPAKCTSRGNENGRVDGDGRSERAYLAGAELHCLVHPHWRR